MSSTECIRDREHRVIGYLEEDSEGNTRVFNPSRSIIGYLNDQGTWTRDWRKLSGSQMPGLLFERK